MGYCSNDCDVFEGCCLECAFYHNSCEGCDEADSVEFAVHCPSYKDGEKNLTKHADEVIAFTKEYIKKNLYPPTFQEIGNAIGLKSKGSIHAVLHNMMEHGLINMKGNGESRTISLPGERIVFDE